MRYNLNLLRVFVTDWQRAVDFYTTLLEMPVSYRNDELGWLQLDTGACQLALERVDSGDPEGPELIGRFIGSSLQVDDVVATYATLAARGVEFVGPPERQPWGGTLAHFRDPDGNVLTLLGLATSGG